MCRLGRMLVRFSLFCLFAIIWGTVTAPSVYAQKSCENNLGCNPPSTICSPLKQCAKPKRPTTDDTPTPTSDRGECNSWWG